MSSSKVDLTKEDLERELKIQRQIAFAAGVFQEDVTIRTLLESIAEGVVIVDNSGTILLVNARAEQMFRYEKQELVGQHHSVLIPEGLRQVHEEYQERFFEAPLCRPMGQLLDLVGLRKDGTEFPVEISLGAIQTIHGFLILALVDDISLRKAAEKKLKQSEELFRIQIGCLNDYAIFMLDVHGNIISWNAGAERLKGYRSDEIIGKHISILYPEEDRKSGKPAELLRQAAEEGRVETQGWRIRKDGSLFWAEVVVTSLRDEDGALRGFSKVTRDITERKQAEDALRLSEARFRALYTDNPTMVVTVDSDFTMLSVNPACVDQLGYTEEELTGQSVLKLFHEADRAGVTEKVSHCLQNPYQVYHWKYRKITKEGALLWVEETAQAVYDLNHKLNVLIVCQDVTAREQLLLQLEAVLESITEAVAISDLHGRILTMNKAALAMHGYDDPEQVRRPLTEFRGEVEFLDMAGQAIPFEQWPLMRAIRGERFLDYELQFHRRDNGKTVIESISGTPVIDKSGEAILAVTTTRDITERKTMEEELRLANAQLQVITENMSIGVARCGRDHRYLWVSTAYASWLGQHPELVVGRPMSEVLGNEAYRSVLPCIERVLAGHKVDSEMKLNFSNLGLRWIEARYMPTYDPAGVPDGWVEVVWDITSRKEMEEELQQSKDLLEHRVAERTAELTATFNRLQAETQQRLQTVEELQDKEQMLIHQGKMAVMGEMIGFIAHQWRQPLNTLGLIVQELPIYFKRGEITQEYLEASAAKARELISHMSRTIDDFRNFFRSEKQKVPFRIKDLLEKTLNLVMPTLREKQTVVDVSIGCDSEVEGYANEYCQVILNILVNMNDAFAERDIKEPRVEIRIFRDRDRCVMTVADNAGGIPEAIIDRVFDAYFTTKAPDKGTGLGLYMAKTIVEKNMGGKLSVRNTGKGAEFRIEV
jgi:PAS domain S-box-containing protein